MANGGFLDTQAIPDFVLGSGTPALVAEPNINVAKNIVYDITVSGDYVRYVPNALGGGPASGNAYGGMYLWFNLPSQGGVLSHICAQSDGGTVNDVFELDLLASGDLRIRMISDGSAGDYLETIATAAQAAINGQTAWDDGTDKFIEIRFDGVTPNLDIYLEGSECVYVSNDTVNNSGFAAGITATPANFTIGDIDGGSANGSTGKVWRFGFFHDSVSSAVRSAGQVSSRYAKEVSLFAANPLCPFGGVFFTDSGSSETTAGSVKMAPLNGLEQILLDNEDSSPFGQASLPGSNPLLSQGIGFGPIIALSPVAFKRKMPFGGSKFTGRPELIFSNRRKMPFGNSIFTGLDEIYTRRRYSEFPLGVDSVLNLPPNVINTIPDQVAIQDSLFDYFVPGDTFEDPEGDPLVFSAQLLGGGALPGWLTFNPSIQRFLGTPDNLDVGVLQLEVCAADPFHGGPGTCTPLNITILNVNDAPITVGVIPDSNIFSNEDFQFTFNTNVFDDPDFIHGDVHTYTANLPDDEPLPGWLSFNPATQTFSGVPPTSAVGVHEIVVTATDTGGLSTTANFFITVSQDVYEPVFPENISYGSSGGPGHNTAIVEVESGAEHRIARWEEAKRSYNVAYGIKKHTDLTQLQEFYLAQQGSFGKFRYKDWLDFNSTADHTTLVEDAAEITAFDQFIGTGDGNQQNFQLIKRYSDGVKDIIRNITKPVSGTLKVAVGGVVMTSGWSIDVTTGLLSFTASPGIDEEITAGFEFHVPCRFGSEVDGALKANVESFATGSLQDIQVVEIREANFVESDFFYGGAVDRDIVADTFISIAQGRVFRISSGAFSNLEVVLPAVDNLSAGGPYFYITNRGTNFLRIVPEQGIGVGQQLANLQQDETITVLLADDGGTLKWVAI